MNLIYLLDTNIISEPLKIDANSNVISKLLTHHNECAIATVVLYEILRGYHKTPVSKKRTLIWQHIQNIVTNVPILPYDQKAATWHAEQQVKLATEGKTPALIDSQIAAIAKTNELILVTRNTKDFNNFKELLVENWFDR